MHHISSELISTVFFKSLVSENVIEKEADKLVMEIAEFTAEHIRRINHGGGNKNPKIVKEYFKKLYSDWDKGVEKLIEKIENLD
mgnify:CR=1 FL=1